MPDMFVKLYQLPEYESLLPALREAEIEVRRALPPEKHIVPEWVNPIFNLHWASECEAALARQPVSCLIAVEADPMGAWEK